MYPYSAIQTETALEAQELKNESEVLMGPTHPWRLTHPYFRIAHAY